MLHAFHLLKSRKCVNPLTSVFLITNDKSPGSFDKIKIGLSKFAIPESFTIHTFGLGRDHDSQLLCQIADLNSGSYYYIEDLENIMIGLLDCLGAV